MPIQRCTQNGKPGWKWGDEGKCYTYTAGNQAESDAAKQKAIKQAIAIGEGKIPTEREEKR